MLHELLAETSSTPITIEGVLLNLGLPGVVILALGLYARGTINAERERSKRLEDDNRRLYQIMAEQMVPALTKATSAVIDATAVMGEIKRANEIAAAVEEVRRKRDEG
jgi:hypothetical protein